MIETFAISEAIEIIHILQKRVQLLDTMVDYNKISPEAAICILKLEKEYSHCINNLKFLIVTEKWKNGR